MESSELMLMQNMLLSETAKTELLKLNDISTRYGLTLSEKAAEELVGARIKALNDTGRVEFSSGVIEKIIYAFCDSPYINQSDYLETLTDLQEAFYYFKSESMDKISDDELIKFMKNIFNGKAQGSSEYLLGTSLEELCRETKYKGKYGEKI